MAIPRRGVTTAFGVPYVIAVAGLAGAGFIQGSTELILGAALLAWPVSMLGVPAYYGAYGLLAQIPGANPDTASGSADQNGVIVSSGEPANWFLVATESLGIVALTLSALLNVVCVHLVLRARARRRQEPSALAGQHYV